MILRFTIFAKRMLAPTLFLSIALSSGCATGQRKVTRQEQLKSLIGQPIDEAVKLWGAPDATHQLTDGTVVYTWRQPWTSSGVNYGVSPGGAIVTHQHLCRTTIQTDSAGVIGSYHC